MDVSQLHLETEFEWDKSKRDRTLASREMDFADGARALLDPHISCPSGRNDEDRTLAICGMYGRVIAVVYMMRGE